MCVRNYNFHLLRIFYIFKLITKIIKNCSWDLQFNFRISHSHESEPSRIYIRNYVDGLKVMVEKVTSAYFIAYIHKHRKPKCVPIFERD